MFSLRAGWTSFNLNIILTISQLDVLFFLINSDPRIQADTSGRMVACYVVKRYVKALHCIQSLKNPQL